MTLKHRWIYYDVYYFERLKIKKFTEHNQSLHLNVVGGESGPAGYSRLSVDCIKRCTKTSSSFWRLWILALVFIILVLDIQDSEAWWWRRRTKSSNCNGGKPYYFGTTNLWCIKKYKRGAAPSRGTWTLKHRWIYYEGFYFERLGNGEVYGKQPTAASKCSWRRESSPAGYSSLSVNCIKRCTEKYRARYGRYRLLSNNCHHFANNPTTLKQQIFGVLKKRGAAPSRGTLTLKHRWIYYDVYYFERLK
ncbi:hypothetical protein KUTeg_023838 [Tegillarca granosa]|uniref:Uncharacterized protein n=1 Tax=Tegillarca granosa TaxID=220873 RepID=A0ABQ9E2W3_TEGGR|nr:hypothetical protein KUTeg_023838 [Tegillarca granosa]